MKKFQKSWVCLEMEKWQNESNVSVEFSFNFVHTQTTQYPISTSADRQSS